MYNCNGNNWNKKSIYPEFIFFLHTYLYTCSACGIVPSPKSSSPTNSSLPLYLNCKLFSTSKYPVFNHHLAFGLRSCNSFRRSTCDEYHYHTLSLVYVDFGIDFQKYNSSKNVICASWIRRRLGLEEDMLEERGLTEGLQMMKSLLFPIWLISSVGRASD